METTKNNSPIMNGVFYSTFDTRGKNERPSKIFIIYKEKGNCNPS